MFGKYDGKVTRAKAAATQRYSPYYVCVFGVSTGGDRKEVSGE